MNLMKPSQFDQPKCKVQNSKMTRKIQLLAIILAISISVGYARGPKKVVEGYDASIMEIPHQVSLRSQNGNYLCGGSIIGAKSILTAAHCLFHRNGTSIKSSIYVVSGTNDLNMTTPHNVDRVVRRVHHGYQFDHAGRNDIAILELNKPILFDLFQTEALLPISDVPVGTRVMVSGWGATAYNRTTEKTSKYPRYLQKYYGNVISEQECQFAMGNSMVIGPQHICVLDPQGADACSGDSGGPLTYKGTVIGVNSIGVGCGLGYPAIFTRVHHYLQWIEIVKLHIQYKLPIKSSRYFVEM